MILDLSQLVADGRDPWNTAGLHKTSDTASMLGSIVSGKNVSVGLVKQPEYKVGDIVSYNINNQRILHRVTHVKPGHVYVKGDQNRFGDGWVALDKVNGKVTTVQKHKK